jgi:hypothetical protein
VSTTAIVTMLVAMATIWGGLALSISVAVRRSRAASRTDTGTHG